MDDTMIFIDTGAFYAMEVEKDINHMAAMGVRSELAGGVHGALLTTNYVINEVLTLLRFKAGHREALLFLDKIMRSKSLKVIRIDEKIEEKAFKIFEKHDDKKISITDATSFAVMEELGIRKAFSFDAHFRQLGFVVVP